MNSLFKHVFLTLCFCVVSIEVEAQETAVKLATDNSSSGFAIHNLSNTSLLSVTGDGSVHFGPNLNWTPINGRLGLGTVSPAARLHVDATGTADGNVLFLGEYGNGASIPATGAGTRLMWYPRKSAFRTGIATGTQWDDTNIGPYSTAMGYAPTASGESAVALGSQTTASGQGAIAVGQSTSSTSSASFAAGLSTTASGLASFAAGSGTHASGSAANALGSNTIAYGNSSTAIGGFTTASGDYSTAMGSFSYATGVSSTSAGRSTYADAYCVFALGRFNVGGGTAGSWVSTDPLFEIGIGTTGLGRANAVTVLKNGNMGIGTAVPDAQLHVTGQVKIAGGSPGAGKVLTSDTDGLASWIAPAAGGGTLDYAYDFGGSGAGRTITADAGALTVAGVDGFLVTGTTNSGSLWATGAGTRMMFYPKKAAFRAGYALSSEWDDANIGKYSTALGNAVIASGTSSTAIGYLAEASGIISLAIGDLTTASGNRSTAMGSHTTASGDYSTAMGAYATASGSNSTAMGYQVNTNGKEGSFIIGDYSTQSSGRVHWNSAANQMKMRFDGGYILYSKSDTSTGVYMNGGTSGWTNVSDRNRKEHFTPIDGEALLAKIRSMPVKEWNYKNTDPSIRYIGPTAQDFWQAFRLGGTDSLGINSIAIDGVNMAAVQALEQRTTELWEAVKKNDRLAAEVQGMIEENRAMKEENRKTAARIGELEQAVLRLQEAMDRGSDQPARAHRIVNTASGE